MREIKFRAWDKRNNKWIHPDLFYISNNAFYPDFRDLEDGISLFDYEYELMQFTGLYDKNGKEIYEGDIILFNNFGDTLDKVVYSPGCFHTSGGGYLLDEIREIEVIGNIYENPELLEENNESR